MTIYFILKYAIHSHRIVCTDSPKCRYSICLLNSLSRSETLLNIAFNLTEQFDQVYITVSVFYKINSVFHKFPIEAFENLCLFLEDPTKTPFLYRINLEKVLNFTSNLLRCPWSTGQYYVHNLSLHQNVLPTHYAQAIPLGEYQMNITFGSKDENLLTTTIDFLHYTFVERKRKPRKNVHFI